MRIVLLLLLSSSLSIASFGQVKIHNLVFKTNQITLSQEQKTYLTQLTHNSSKGQRLTIYPLQYDEISKRHFFSKNAQQQAKEIAKFSQSIGLILKGMPRNFPSKHKGISISVNLKYDGVPTNEAQAEPYTLQANSTPKPSQYFIINPNRDTIIYGNEGTVLYFNAGCLLSKDTVLFELKEFYQLADYMKNNLPTTSNGNMIETGGSIFINAKDKKTDRTIGIDPTLGIDIAFTKGKTDSEMQLFIKDPKSATFNWILPKVKKSYNSWEMTETLLDQNGNVLLTKTFTSEVEWKKYKKEKAEQALREEEQKELKRENATLVDKTLRTFKLGYINCDKFIDEPTSNFAMYTDKNRIAEYFLVYSDIRGVLKGHISSDKVLFSSVPSNRKATLIAISYEDNLPYFFKSEIVIGSKNVSEVLLKRVSQDFINQQLALLN